MAGKSDPLPPAGNVQRPKANSQILASKGTGLSAEVLARALETRSSAPTRRPLQPARALENQEIARRYARAKDLLAQKAREARLAAELPEEGITTTTPARFRFGDTRFGRWLQPLSRQLVRPMRRVWRYRWDLGWRPAVCAGMSVAAALVLHHDASAWFPRPGPAYHEITGSSVWQRLSSNDWFQRAEDRAAEGNFRRALNTVQYALASAPKNVDLLVFAGNMHQSLLEFADAQRAYEQALRFDPKNSGARENLTLCRRLNRYHDNAAAYRSSLYGLHRVMLSQSRISEAVAICRRLGKGDRALQQATWQAALSETGLPGRLTVDADGELELDLSNAVEPDLSLLKGFPLVGLNLAGTGLEDLRALRGMMLKRLDLSRTLVHNLAPLRGMPLQSLGLRGTGVVELSDLERCPLRELDISNTKVEDLGPLAYLPIHTLEAADTVVADLRPLAAMPLTRLNLARTRVCNLAPLSNLGLRFLALDGTRVADLAPLTGCRLQELHLAGTVVDDLAPLAGMPLTLLDLAGCAGVRDLSPLAACPELEHLQLPPRALPVDSLAGLPRLRFVRSGESKPADANSVLNPAGTTESRRGIVLSSSLSGGGGVPSTR